jgi:hypothetical protein
MRVSIKVYFKSIELFPSRDFGDVEVHRFRKLEEDLIDRPGEKLRDVSGLTNN